MVPRCIPLKIKTIHLKLKILYWTNTSPKWQHPTTQMTFKCHHFNKTNPKWVFSTLPPSLRRSSKKSMDWVRDWNLFRKLMTNTNLIRLMIERLRICFWISHSWLGLDRNRVLSMIHRLPGNKQALSIYFVMKNLVSMICLCNKRVFKKWAISKTWCKVLSLRESNSGNLVRWEVKSIRHWVTW